MFNSGGIGNLNINPHDTREGRRRINMTGREKHMEYLQAKSRLDALRPCDLVYQWNTREGRFLYRSFTELCDALLYAYIKGDPRSLLIEIHCGNAGLVSKADDVINHLGIKGSATYGYEFNKLCTQKYSKFTRASDSNRDYLR